MIDKYWKHLMKNIEMSAEHGAAGARELSNPKLSGRIRKGNQSTKRHKITITIEDLKELWSIQKGKCYWMGIDMSLEDLFLPHSPFAVSVDRVDSKKGYHKSNIVLTTRFANRGRGKYDNADFVERLDSLLKNRTKEKINLKIFGCVSKKPTTLMDFFT